MATRTPNYGLTKPAGIEDAQISVINANMDILDTELHLTTVRDAQNLAPLYDPTAGYSEGDFVTFYVTNSGDANGYHIYKANQDITEPAGNFDTNEWDLTNIVSEMGSSGGSGGHTYIGNDGSTAMTQRDNAQFVGAYMEDDSSNDITKVNVMRSMHHADFEQLSDAEKKGIIFVDDETGAVEDKFQPVIYSLEEREIGVWTDGKPLYEKTIIADSLSSGDNTILHGISNLDVIVSEKSVLWYNNDSFVPLPATSTSSGWSSRTRDFSSTSYVVEIGSAAASYADKCYTTLQYTKTTDTAGSGQWTPQGVPTVHYSTTEQLVGTYHGEPLYQKDIDISLADSSDMQTFTSDTLGIGRTKVVVDAYFKNSGGQQLRMTRWYGNDYWSYIITDIGNILIKRNASDPNWTTGVHFIATVQYIKASS